MTAATPNNDNVIPLRRRADRRAGPPGVVAAQAAELLLQAAMDAVDRVADVVRAGADQAGRGMWEGLDLAAIEQFGAAALDVVDRLSHELADPRIKAFRNASIHFPADEVPRCGAATTTTGKPCQEIVGAAGGRCRHHRGISRQPWERTVAEALADDQR